MVTTTPHPLCAAGGETSWRNLINQLTLEQIAELGPGTK